MSHRRLWIEAAVRGILTLCLSLALCIDMRIPGLLDGQTAVQRLWHITGLAAKGSLVTPLFFLLLWANWRIDGQKTERRIAFTLVNGFIALIWLMGEGFRVDNTLWTLHASYMQIVKSSIYFIGIAYGLNQITYLLYSALEKRGAKSPEHILTDQKTWQALIVKVYREHTVLVSFGAVFVLWLPHLILAYPANLSGDEYNQLAQFFGLISYSGHFPVTSTLIMGGLVKFGSLISSNFGCFLYIAVQTIIGAWILAYTLHLIRELNAPVWLRILTFCCYVFVPYYTAYIGTFTKDVPYAFAALLFVTELIYFFVRSEDVFRNKRHILLLALSIVGLIFMRKNGKYMLYPSIAVILVYLFFRMRKSKADSRGRRRTLYSIAAIFLIPVLLAEAFSAFLMSYLDATPGSIREAISLPFQQTARYVKEFGDEVTEEEKAAISAVLDYEHLAELYDPQISDPVKRFERHSENSLVKDTLRYILVWLKQFTKHPFVYFKATINQNYYLLYPYIPNSAVTIARFADPLEGSMKESVVELLGISDVEPVASIKPQLRTFYTICFYLPGLNLLSHPAFYVTLLIWLTLFSLYKKRFLWLLASIPVWLGAVTVVLAPVIQSNPRYAFPVIYAMPVILAYYIYLERSEKPRHE